MTKKRFITHTSIKSLASLIKQPNGNHISIAGLLGLVHPSLDEPTLHLDILALGDTLLGLINQGARLLELGLDGAALEVAVEGGGEGVDLGAARVLEAAGVGTGGGTGARGGTGWGGAGGRTWAGAGGGTWAGGRHFLENWSGKSSWFGEEVDISQRCTGRLFVKMGKVK